MATSPPPALPSCSARTAAAAIAILGIDGKPTRARAAEYALLGGASVEEAAEFAATPHRDDYRRALVAELVRRALSEAAR